MKKTLIFMFVVTFTILFTTGAFAGWKLYDDFEGYADIEELKDSDKWSISAEDEAIATFSIEDGRLKIEHIAGNPDDSAWAQLIQNVKKIKGIRATIEVESWDGNVRARIGAEVGVLSDNPDHLVWHQMELRRRTADPDEEYVRGNDVVLDLLMDFDFLYSLFYTELGFGKNPVAGVPYTIETKWSKKKANFRVDDPEDVGQVKFKFIEKIDVIDEPFRGIGTRSNDDEGTCVVYFDDVYVLK